MGALQRWLGRRRESGFLAGVLIPLYVATASVAVAVPVALSLFDGLAPGASDGCSLHVGAALSGSSEVFAREVSPGCDLTLEEARATIRADFAFAPVYAVAGAASLWWLWPRAWRISRMRKLRWVAFAPVAAAAFDLVENAFVLAGLEDGPSLRELPARAAAAVGWWKWMLVSFAVLATAACVCGAIGNRGVPQPPPRRPRRADEAPLQDAVGICLSGGGIRSASFALGALRALDRRALLRSARWIAGVSGGAYAASAWFVGRGTAAEAGAVRPQPRGDVDGLLDPAVGPNLFEYLCKNRRYLSTGRGGLSATFVTGAFLAAFNVLVLATLVCLVAWPVGRLAATWAVQPGLRSFDYAGVDGQSLDVPLRLWLPGLLGFAAAAVSWLVALTLWAPARTTVLRAGAFFFCGGAALLAFLVGVPVAMAEAPKLWEALGPEPLEGAGLTTIAAAIGVAAALTRLAVKPLAATAKRVGGVLLGLIAFLLAGRVATDAAYGNGWFAGSTAEYAAALAAFAVFYLLANPQSWSLFRLYYLRLRSTFATTQNPARRAPGAPGHAGVYPLSLEHEAPWHAYRGRSGPELLVCAAAQRNGDAVTGVRALSLTFSDRAVALRDATFDGSGRDVLRVDEAAPPESYFARLRRPERWGPRYDSVSAAVAMSGAAFTSAMGRQSLGTTNALLAALDVRLGVWMPNPCYPEGQRPLKRPRLGYLLKEVFGIYDPDDPYVYVTDGGHWENLGLVELVRRRAQWIVCVDASGDAPDSFATLEEAIVMARVECGAEILIDTEPLKRRDGKLPQTAVATGVIRYHSCGGTGRDSCPVGLLFYGKALVAADSPINTLSFSLRDGIYPRYPTYDQFLSEDQFMNLVRLGEAVGRTLALEYERRRW